MCGGTRLQKWMAECIRHLVLSGLAEPALLIRDVTPSRPAPVSARTFLYDIYDLYWVRKRCPAAREVDMEAELGAVPTLDCAVTTQGKWSQHFSAHDIDTIKSHDLDFILRFGFNIIRGEILQSARYGVWSYHHDDEHKYRGGPPCFWELYHGDDTTGAILQRLTGRLDGGIILHRGVFGTCKGSWIANFDRALSGSADWCARVCAEISDGQLERVNGTPTPSTAAIRHAPHHAQFLRFVMRTSREVLRKTWQLMFHEEVWNIAFVEEELAQIIRRRRITGSTLWVKPHEDGHFLADPFPCGDEVLVEDYDQAGKGKLSRLCPPFVSNELSLRPAIDRAEHLSYPCVFVDGEKIYCVPEAYQAERAIIYERRVEGWREAHSILHGLKVVDPTLFMYEGRYWLFYSLQDDGAFGNLKLYAHYAETISGEWRPHLLNPLKCDITSSRSAGQVARVDGRLYRPAQDCSRTYGGALTINEVLELTPTRFEERVTARLTPDADGPYPDGLHTVNAMGTRTVIDGKRFVFDPWAWRNNWRRAREILL